MQYRRSAHCSSIYPCASLEIYHRTKSEIAKKLNEVQNSSHRISGLPPIQQIAGKLQSLDRIGITAARSQLAYSLNGLCPDIVGNITDTRPSIRFVTRTTRRESDKHVQIPKWIRVNLKDKTEFSDLTRNRKPVSIYWTSRKYFQLNYNDKTLCSTTLEDTADECITDLYLLDFRFSVNTTLCPKAPRRRFWDMYVHTSEHYSVLFVWLPAQRVIGYLYTNTSAESAIQRWQFPVALSLWGLGTTIGVESLSLSRSRFLVRLAAQTESL
jgi:hypothetical protein